MWATEYRPSIGTQEREGGSTPQSCSDLCALSSLKAENPWVRLDVQHAWVNSRGPACKLAFLNNAPTLWGMLAPVVTLANGAAIGRAVAARAFKLGRLLAHHTNAKVVGGRFCNWCCLTSPLLPSSAHCLLACLMMIAPVCPLAFTRAVALSIAAGAVKLRCLAAHTCRSWTGDGLILRLCSLIMLRRRQGLIEVVERLAPIWWSQRRKLNRFADQRRAFPLLDTLLPLKNARARLIVLLKQCCFDWFLADDGSDPVLCTRQRCTRVAKSLERLGRLGLFDWIKGVEVALEAAAARLAAVHKERENQDDQERANHYGRNDPHGKVIAAVGCTYARATTEAAFAAGIARLAGATRIFHREFDETRIGDDA
eukprot:m.314614 g.314614  ORF g.314614 m.314614 type:complete len:369 (-) comp38343_c0_seq1:292-1398(-)